MSRRGDGHERYVLTQDDVKYLRGEKNLTNGSAENARHRIRTRAKCALEDLRFLSHCKVDWNPRQLVVGMGPDGDGDQADDERYLQLTSILGLMVTLGRLANIDEQRVIEDGVLSGANSSVKGVDVQLVYDYHDEYNWEDVKSQVENGEMPSPTDIGMLFYFGHDEREVTFGEETRPIREFLHAFAQERGLDHEIVHVF